jgi:pimeloyl-ACP methyl ester carboxylesterase
MPRRSDKPRGGEAVHGAPPIGRLYDVNGRHLRLYRSGSGSRTVLFAPGAGLVALDYLDIHDQVSQLTTSVLYDRAGTRWSDPVELPRAAALVTDELRNLLRAARVPARYLLVGHSLGGFYVRPRRGGGAYGLTWKSSGSEGDLGG